MLRRTWRARTLARVLAGAAVVALAATGGWWFGSRDAAAATATGPTTSTQSVAASVTTLEKSVSASGTLTPAVQEDVSFAVSGTVTSVDVEVGQTVTAGQTLATVDTLQLDADLLSAKASLATAKATLENAEDDDDGSTAADAQIASYTAQVTLAQTKVDTASEAVAAATLVSPVDGLVTTASLEVGDVVSAGSSASTQGSTGTTGTSSGQFVVIGTDSWVVSATVGESDISLISVDDQVSITVDGATTPIFGTVSEIGLISTTSGGVASFPVTVAVTGQQSGLHDGVSAELSIVYERRTDVLTVPSAAIRTVDGQSVVSQTDADGAEVSTPVTVGETSGSSTEILSGLAEGDEVLVTVVTRTGSTGTTGTGRGTSDTQQVPQGVDPAQGGGGPGGPANG